MVFPGLFFILKLPQNPILTANALGLILRQFAGRTVDDLVESSEHIYRIVVSDALTIN